jgi:hypothetical protein
MLARALIAAGVILFAASTSGGAARAQTPEPSSSTPTAVVTSEPTPAAPVNPQPATPLPGSGDASTIVGYIIEDTDGDGLRSMADKGTQTLVQMHRLWEGRIVSGASVFSDENGRFEFTDASEGEYLLWVWWTPGFVTLEGGAVSAAVEGHPDLLLLGISIGPDKGAAFKYVAVQDELDHVVVRDAGGADPTLFSSLTVLVKPKPEGLVPYPVPVGDREPPIQIGRASLTQFSMPPSGTGAGRNIGTSWLLIGIGAVLIVATTVFLCAEKRMKGRRA